MASVKAMKFEKDLLDATAAVKQLVHENFSDNSEVKQQFLIGINNIFEIAHSESRRLRKACAFLHKQCDEYSAQIIRLGHRPIKVDPKDSAFRIADQLENA